MAAPKSAYAKGEFARLRCPILVRSAPQTMGAGRGRLSQNPHLMKNFPLPLMAAHFASTGFARGARPSPSIGRRQPPNQISTAGLAGFSDPSSASTGPEGKALPQSPNWALWNTGVWLCFVTASRPFNASNIVSSASGLLVRTHGL